MREKLIDQLGLFLLKKDYAVKTLSHSCFDLVARGREHIFLIKVLSDANSLSKEMAGEMRRVATYMNSIPVIVAERAGRPLNDNVIYGRFGIYTLTFETFRSCIEKNPQFIKSTTAGLTVSVSGDGLRQKRDESGYSINELSRRMGVSSRMIKKYEQENSEMTLAKAERLYDLFGEEVFLPVNIFSADRFRREPPLVDNLADICRKYTELGFDSSEFRRMPFDIIARNERETIVTEFERMNPQVQSISKMMDADNLIIFEKRRPDSDMPSISREDFLEIEKARELIRFLKEF